MPEPKTPLFPTAQDAENAFYEAIERADLEAMMGLWSDDEEIVCIHPGGRRHTGFAAVREAWRRVFEGGARLRIVVSTPAVVQTPFTVVHNVVEQISVVGEEGVRAPVVATNIYQRTAFGWRLIVHHASPAPPDTEAPTTKTLH